MHPHWSLAHQSLDHLVSDLLDHWKVCYICVMELSLMVPRVHPICSSERLLWVLMDLRGFWHGRRDHVGALAGVNGLGLCGVLSLVLGVGALSPSLFALVHG